MDLRGGNISVRELMQSPGAKGILQREFPGLMGSPMLMFAQGMSLNRVIAQVNGKVPREKIQDVINQLKAL